MVDLYVTLIINKKKILSEVPKTLRSDVLKELKNLGYDEFGDPIQ